MSNQFQIRVHSGSLRGQAFVINKQEFKIGRDPSCDIVLTESAVSRVHLLIYPQPYDAIVLVDNNSTNGTTVNNVQVTAPVQIAENDVIVLGGEVALVLEKVPSMQNAYPPYQTPNYNPAYPNAPQQQIPSYQPPAWDTNYNPSFQQQNQNPYVPVNPVNIPVSGIPNQEINMNRNDHEMESLNSEEQVNNDSDHIPSSPKNEENAESVKQYGFNPYESQQRNSFYPNPNVPFQPNSPQPQSPYPGQVPPAYYPPYPTNYENRPQDPYISQQGYNPQSGQYNPQASQYPSQYPPSQQYPPYPAPYGADSYQQQPYPYQGYPQTPSQQYPAGYYQQQPYGGYGPAAEYGQADNLQDENAKKKKLYIILGIVLVLILAIIGFIIYIDSNYLWCDVFPFLWSPEACAIYP